MALFPDVQKRAQAELDRVVGRHRLPEFEDLEHLPYIRATVMETVRWMPVVPAGVPHRSIMDDEYKGFHIPKGTAIVPVSVCLFLFLLCTSFLIDLVERMVCSQIL